MMNQQEKEIVEYPSTRKLLMLLLGSLVFVAMGLLLMMVGLSEEDGSLGMTLVGIVTLAFFGACLLYFVYRLFNRKPSLIINDEWIEDNSSYTAGGRIKWEDIREIALYEMMGQRFLGIKLHDEDAYLQRQSGFKKWLMKVNSGMVQAPVNIPQNGIKMKLEALHDIMAVKLEQAAARSRDRLE
ncbi:hypothetical protein DNH61_25485 [Paenibacillus sambharensis]|uniref:Uncharacterized protein n=1 Tax=Paenibacillus sambharensis TaxID=1803190 RepID=A0A2W1LNG6_9BACL|nr:STM3941 family protein [Paenibacillus sambharensis]PZD92957.1 hypothetical protein DNH61_25485 [Paenibacillus sambharensis]